jgi:AcrR family transcriptional regulator
MARPKSEDRRNAIMRAATQVIVAQGLSAPTALIAREAGISNGSLFTYFDTKADLFNQLYLELKTEMAMASLAGLAVGAGSEATSREQMFLVWSNWMHWASDYPQKRAVLAQLAVSEDMTPATRQAGHQAMGGLAGLLERVRAGGPMRDAPMGFVVAIMNGVAEATIDFMAQEPDRAELHCQAGFDAMWRIIG